MEKLNDFEKSILLNLSKYYPVIKEHIEFLGVKDREITGVGMYINLGYLPIDKNINIFLPLDANVSTNDIISIDSLDFGLGYEVFVKNGLIKYL